MTRRNRRTGFTLIECVTVVGGMTVLLAFSVALLHQLLRLDRGQRDRLVRVPVGFELDRSFRDDVHQAGRPPVVEPTTLSLTLSDGSEVRYVAEPDQVQRVRERKGHPPHRERYLLPFKSEVRFESQSRGEASIVRLIRLEPGALDPDKRRASTVEAIAGRDLIRGGK